jgi:hypothetical protein
MNSLAGRAASFKRYHTKHAIVEIDARPIKANQIAKTKAGVKTAQESCNAKSRLGLSPATSRNSFRVKARRACLAARSLKSLIGSIGIDLQPGVLQWPNWKNTRKDFSIKVGSRCTRSAQLAPSNKPATVSVSTSASIGPCSVALMKGARNRLLFAFIAVHCAAFGPRRRIRSTNRQLRLAKFSLPRFCRSSAS